MKQNETKAIRPFGMKDKCAYMMGELGCNLVLTLANSYLLIFATKVLGGSRRCGRNFIFVSTYCRCVY